MARLKPKKGCLCAWYKPGHSLTWWGRHRPRLWHRLYRSYCPIHACYCYYEYDGGPYGVPHWVRCRLHEGM